MSTENDVPLGEEAHHYYEQQFGERIHQIKKGGRAPRRDSGSNWNGRAGCGGILVVIVLLRVIVAFIGTLSNKSSDPPIPGLAPPEFVDPQLPLAEQIQQANAEAEAALLRDSDVPLPEGLCYRMYQESRRPEATPGKHILELLDPDARKLLIRSAHGQPLVAEQHRDLLDGLNDVLQHDDFWDEDAFHQPMPVAELLHKGGIDVQLHGFDNLVATRLKERRQFLERCYPRQIVPLEQRLRLEERERAEWKRRAQRDLAEARRERERAKD